MIIDFRLHTNDNALVENGVQIAVCSLPAFDFLSISLPLHFYHLHFHVITFAAAGGNTHLMNGTEIGT